MTDDAIRFFDEDNSDRKPATPPPAVSTPAAAAQPAAPRPQVRQPVPGGIGRDPVPGMMRLTPDKTSLVLLNGARGQQRFPLTAMRTVIGRNDLPDVAVDIDLTDHEPGDTPMVSRRHALCQWVGGELQLIDLGSRNGTTLDGKPLGANDKRRPSEPVALKANSQIAIGNLKFQVMTHG